MWARPAVAFVSWTFWRSWSCEFALPVASKLATRRRRVFIPASLAPVYRLLGFPPVIPGSWLGGKLPPDCNPGDWSFKSNKVLSESGDRISRRELTDVGRRFRSQTPRAVTKRPIRTQLMRRFFSVANFVFRRELDCNSAAGLRIGSAEEMLQLEKWLQSRTVEFSSVQLPKCCKARLTWRKLAMAEFSR